MISQRTLRLLSKLAARDLANAEQKVADALVKAQRLEHEARMIEGYRRGLVTSLRGRRCRGYDFIVTTGFVTASLKAQEMAEAARRQGERAKLAAVDRLAIEMQRRDALDTATDAAAAATAQLRERRADRLASPSTARTSTQR
jgi:hypothetical protein